jgi:hypothetical protein
LKASPQATTEVINIDNKPADRFCLKDNRILSSAASIFFLFITEVNDLIDNTKYTNTYEDKIRKLLKEQKIKYENTSDAKKKDMNIYYSCLKVDKITSKALYGKGMNLANATTYVKKLLESYEENRSRNHYRFWRSCKGTC